MQKNSLSKSALCKNPIVSEFSYLIRKQAEFLRKVTVTGQRDKFESSVEIISFSFPDRMSNTHVLVDLVAKFLVTQLCHMTFRSLKKVGDLDANLEILNDLDT